jgi:hypothetical protein
MMLAAAVVAVAGCRTPSAPEGFVMMASRVESGPPVPVGDSYTVVLSLAEYAARMRDLGIDPTTVAVRVQAVTDAGWLQLPGTPGWYEAPLATDETVEQERPTVAFTTRTFEPTLRLRSQIQISGRPLGARPAVAVETDAMARVGDAREVATYFQEGDEALAQSLLERLRPLREHAIRLTGLETTTPFGVAVVRSDAPTLVVTDPGVWPYRVPADDFDRMLPILVHELVETALHDLVRLREDPANRWISDGIAEWAAFRSLEAAGEYCALRTMILGHLARAFRAAGPLTARYDLRRFRWPDGVARGDTEILGDALSAEPAGYAMALMFWIEYEETYGPEAIRRFLERARGLDEVHEANLMELIDDVAGKAVADTSRAMNLVVAHRSLMEWARVVSRRCRDQKAPEIFEKDPETPVSRGDLDAILGAYFPGTEGSADGDP